MSINVAGFGASMRQMCRDRRNFAKSSDGVLLPPSKGITIAAHAVYAVESGVGIDRAFQSQETGQANMMRTIQLAVACVAVLVVTVQRSDAGIITFDDLTQRASFGNLGIQSSYQGFRWGYSTTPGLNNANIPQAGAMGWASATTTNPATPPAPTPISGSSYAWNWDGPQSLFIDFQTPHDVASGYFAVLSSSYGLNASSVQLFGYDQSSALVASSSILLLTDTFQQLNAGFIGVQYLEIRANANSRWFSIDNIDVSPTTSRVIPEPSSLAIFGIGACVVGIGVTRRRRRESATMAAA